MGDQGMFVVHMLWTCCKTIFFTLNKFQLEVTHISIICNFTIAYSATDINRVTWCPDVYMWSYVKVLGLAKMEEDLVCLSNLLYLINCVCWVGLGLPKGYADEEIASILWKTIKMN